MRYRKIHTRTFNDARFMSLGSEARHCFLTILACGRDDVVPGIMRITIEDLRLNLGSTTGRTTTAMGSLVGSGLVKYDQDAALLYLPNALKYDRPSSPDNAKRWLDWRDSLPEHPLTKEAINAAYEHLLSRSSVDGDHWSNLAQALGRTIGWTTGRPGVEPPQPQPQPQPQPHPHEKNMSRSQAKRESRDVDSVIEFYRSFHPRTRPGKKEAALIQARLDEGFTAEELRTAIEGNWRCPHNRGDNERGKKYQTLELIVRDSAKVNQFIKAFDEFDENGLPYDPIAANKGKRLTNGQRLRLEAEQARREEDEKTENDKAANFRTVFNDLHLLAEGQ